MIIINTKDIIKVYIKIPPKFLVKPVLIQQKDSNNKPKNNFDDTLPPS